MSKQQPENSMEFTHGPVISVMLAVPDATVAAQWYAQALGATELWNMGGVVGLTVEGAPFFLFASQ
jgi:PhnB protein